ncbi:transglycosylase domain-containing protein [Myxococcota bacterium]|nr:transglycosylase domain-containing protein [Myxococcota bacterium]
MPVRLEVVNPRSPRILARLFRLAGFLAVAGSVLALEAAGLAYLHFARDLPEIPPFEAIRFQTASRVLSRHGMPLAEHFQQRRYLVPREAIPERLVQAVMASEDARFFEHRGLDLRGIARALWTNLRAGEVREGASTLTQQVARSLLLGTERSLRRKVREAILARRIEDLYTKDQILTLYLNLIFLGQGAYGVGAAAQVYFGKPLDQLTLPEIAVLAALPQSPGRVNPVSDPEEMRRRRDRVIRRMAETGAITEAEEEEARRAPLVAARGRDLLGDRAPFATQAAWEEIEPFLRSREDGNLLEGGGGITAWISVDVGPQRAAEEAVRRGAVALARRQGWPGPLMRLSESSRKTFLQRNREFLSGRGLQDGSPPMGMAVLAMVASVDSERAVLDLGLPRRGRLVLDRMRWATPYREFPREADGKRREIPAVSLDGRLKSVSDALHPGDVVLVRRVASKPPDPPAPKRRGRKGGKDVASAPQPQPPEAAAPLDDYELDLFPIVQAALGALDHRTGEWIAEVGSTDWDASQVLRTESVRQSGSTVKPLYYSFAYDQGIAPSSVLPAAPFREGDWVPEGGTKEESLTLWEALVQSENAVSARLFQVLLSRYGVEALNAFLARLGIRHPLQGLPAEALGANLSLAEMIRAFAAFARQGIRSEPHRLIRVVDGEGRTLLDRRSPLDPMVGLLDLVALAARPQEEETRRALSVQGAYLIRENLREVATRGTGSRAKVLKRPVAGKTGTLPFDVWFLGFTPEWAVGTWVGQDQRERWLGRSKARGLVFGADTALPVFIDFLERATRDRPPVPFPGSPPGIVEVPVNPRTGELQSDGGVRMPHIEGTEPKAPEEAPADPDAALEF